MPARRSARIEKNSAWGGSRRPFRAPALSRGPARAQRRQSGPPTSLPRPALALGWVGSCGSRGGPRRQVGRALDPTRGILGATCIPSLDLRRITRQPGCSTHVTRASWVQHASWDAPRGNRAAAIPFCARQWPARALPRSRPCHSGACGAGRPEPYPGRTGRRRAPAAARRTPCRPAPPPCAAPCCPPAGRPSHYLMVTPTSRPPTL